MGSERPENCPVDSFQWRTGGSPGKGVATIEIAESAMIEVADTTIDDSRDELSKSLIWVTVHIQRSGRNLERAEVNRKEVISTVWSYDL